MNSLDLARKANKNPGSFILVAIVMQVAIVGALFTGALLIVKAIFFS